MVTQIILAILLIVIAIALLLVEIFLLPGITIAGIAGALFAVGAFVYVYSTLGAVASGIALVCGVIVFAVVFFWLLKSKALDRISLKTNSNSKVDDSDLDKIAIGDTGIAYSRLNPMGKVKIKGVIVEAKSIEEYIDEETPVRVTGKNMSNIEVVSMIEPFDAANE